MADRLEFGFTLQSAGAPAVRRLAPDAPMRLLLVGDFSGGAERGAGDVASIATRPIVRIDLDNFDQVLKRLTPSVRLELAGRPAVEMTMTALDDFHPDRLVRGHALFRPLRELRARLQDPATFAAAAAELAGALPSAGAAAPSPAAPPAESDSDAVARLLGRTPGPSPDAPRPAGAPTGAPGVDAFVRGLIAPHVVADTTSFQRAKATAAVAGAIGELLRLVLHAPAFQALEASWRGLRWLLENLELDDDLQVHLLDLTRAELLADAQAMHADRDASALRRRIAGGPAAGAAGPHWSVCVTLFDVGASDDDLTWLSALGAIAAQAGVPTLATARPSLLGIERMEHLPDPHDWPRLSGTAAAYWHALRHSELAPWIGLAAPRLLMRQPYGPATDPIDEFPFQEVSGAPEHAHLLWAPAALGCALLLARAFRQNHWQMQPGDVLQITDLPAYVVDRDGERELQPCAEVVMSERAALAISERGVMALASYRDRAEARLVRFQSIAEPPRALSGPWS